MPHTPKDPDISTMAGRLAARLAEEAAGVVRPSHQPRTNRVTEGGSSTAVTVTRVTDGDGTRRV